MDNKIKKRINIKTKIIKADRDINKYKDKDIYKDKDNQARLRQR